MAETIILSTVSAWALGDRFQDTLSQKNEAMREAKVAKADGDLSENAPYQAAKEKFRTMGRIQRRLTREMNDLIDRGHTLVDPLTWAAPELPVAEAVEIGTVVAIRSGNDHDLLLIAGARDHHVPETGDLVPTPYNSPLGGALLGQKPGAHLSPEINGHRRELTVLAVRRPTTEEVLEVFPSLRGGG